MADHPLQNRDLPDMTELNGLRDAFRQKVAALPSHPRFQSRIGVVLSGGGARGAYEAGVLMAFQDAEVPTHIVAATSIGSINAAGFAAHAVRLSPGRPSGPSPACTPGFQ